MRHSTGNLTREIIVKTKMTPYAVDIVKEVNNVTNECSLLLVASTFGHNHSIDISHSNYKCSLFMNVTILGHYNPRNKKSYVFFESAFGGDGDHTLPILQIFEIDKSGIKKLGEATFSSFSYVRSGNMIDHVIGEEIVDLCFDCIDFGVPKEDLLFTIPTRITIGCSGICEEINLTKSDQLRVLEKMEKIKNIAVEKGRDNDSVRQQINKIEESIINTKNHFDLMK